jgi:predicted glycosyltransferase involved in capsule biosynthesis
MGRAHHLKQTLPANLVHNSNVDTEFVVLSYNSKDDLHEWMQQFLATNPMAFRVAYFHERTAQFFDPRHAKNVAHLLATGDVVVNLDADNFTGPEYATKLVELFASPNVCVTTNDVNKSMSGKIALRKDAFLRLRGYDESFTGWGGEDLDLVRRAVNSGIGRVELVWNGESAIAHSDEDRVRNFQMGGKARYVTNRDNVDRSRRRPPTELVNKAGFGKALVYVGLTDRTLEVGVRGEAG